MSVNRWSPWDDMLSLREAMSQLMEDSVVRSPQGAMRGTLALDLFESADNVEVTATLPGLNPEEVQITVQGDVLVIRGEHKQQEERKPGNYHLRERRVGSFYRAVQLPCRIQADSAQAEFRNGVLYLTLPKAAETKPRQIPVRVGGPAATQGQIGQGQPIGQPYQNSNGHENGNGHPPAAATDTIEGESRPAETAQR